MLLLLYLWMTGRGDPRNIPGVILDCDDKNMYTIAVKTGIISSK